METLSPELQKYFTKIREAAVPTDGKKFFEGSESLPSETFKYPTIKEKLEEGLTTAGRKFRIIKDVSRSMINHEEFLAEVPARHVFLIRHPYRVFYSMTRTVREMCQRIGFGEVDFDMFRGLPSFHEYVDKDHCHTLWKHLQETQNVTPLIIETEDLVNHPEKILPELFRYSGIPFEEKYLKWSESRDVLKKWKTSERSMVANWGLKTFERAFTSSSFVPHSNPLPKKEDLPSVYSEHIHILVKSYEEMHNQRFQPS